MQQRVASPVAAAENWLLARFDASSALARAATDRLAGVTAPPRLACARCRSDWPTHTMSCPSCGGSLQPLVPMAVQCGFCGSSNRRDVTVECSSCGGALPSIPGGFPGAQPPDPPRRLPPIAHQHTDGLRAENRMLGYIFMGFGVLGLIVGVGLIFLAAGAWLAFGWKLRDSGKRAALDHGHATRGRITRISSEEIHYQPDVKAYKAIRYAIEYEYDADKKRKGKCLGFDPAHALRRPGDEVWVVYVPGQAWLRNALWPPVQ